MEKHSVSRLSYLFAHLHLLSSDSFSSTLLSSNLSLLSASALLCFSSVHIVGSLTSKLPSMKKLHVPKIKPINVKQYEFKQSPYPQADKLPFRAIIVSALQGGKGILIQNFILKIYRGCFERIYIVSPAAHIDEAYKEVIRYIEKELKNRQQKRAIFV